MPALQGKKEIVIGSKVSQAEYDALQWICDSQDRSMSYVLRELAMRGLANFFNDGQIRTDELENRAIENGMKQVKRLPTSGRIIPVATNDAKPVPMLKPKSARKRRVK